MLSILIFADIYLIDIHIRGALGMEIKKDLKMMEGISWGSILAGVITVLSASLLFSTLGTSLGFSITDPLSSEPVKGVATRSNMVCYFSHDQLGLRGFCFWKISC